MKKTKEEKMLKALTKMKPSNKTMYWLSQMAEMFEKEGYTVRGYTWTSEGFALQLDGLILGKRAINYLKKNVYS